MKPRFRAEWVVVREELLILASSLLIPMSRNSVLEELRVRRFAVIQEERESDYSAAQILHLNHLANYKHNKKSQ